jgi:adenylate cyclase class IV
LSNAHLKTNHSSRHHHHHGKMKLSDFVGNGKGRLTYKQVILEMYGKQEESLEVERTTKSMRTFIKNIRRSPSNNKQKRREIYKNLPLDVLSTT